MEGVDTAGPNVPLPLPANRVMVCAGKFPEARSAFPSPLKSPATMLEGSVSVGTVTGEPSTVDVLPSRTDRLLPWRLLVTTSARPSLLKSAVRTTNGPSPTVKSIGVANVPLPFPVSTCSLSAPKSATTRSSFPSPLKSPAAGSKLKTGRPTSTGVANVPVPFPLAKYRNPPGPPCAGDRDDAIRSVFPSPSKSPSSGRSYVCPAGSAGSRARPAGHEVHGKIRPSLQRLDARDHRPEQVAVHRPA